MLGWALGPARALLAQQNACDRAHWSSLKFKDQTCFFVGAMRQRKLGSHTPPCHRRMVITTMFSVFLAALQRRPVLYHTRWLLTVLWLFLLGGGGVLTKISLRGLLNGWFSR